MSWYVNARVVSRKGQDGHWEVSHDSWNYNIKNLFEGGIGRSVVDYLCECDIPDEVKAVFEGHDKKSESEDSFEYNSTWYFYDLNGLYNAKASAERDLAKKREVLANVEEKINSLEYMKLSDDEKSNVGEVYESAKYDYDETESIYESIIKLVGLAEFSEACNGVYVGLRAE